MLALSGPESLVSFVDSIFAPIPPLLINQFGSEVTFVRRTKGEYDEETGLIKNAEKRFKVKAVFDSLKIEELGGIYQSTDARLYFDPVSIGGGIVTTEDAVEYMRSGRKIFAKVIKPDEIRGDESILFDVIVRPE